MELEFHQIESPLGPLYVVADKTHLHAIIFERNWTAYKLQLLKSASLCASANPVTRNTVRQLDEYFSGQRTEFNIPLYFGGTEFQKKVWQALVKIPFGQTRTYQEQAAAIGRPTAMRAVGGTNGRNPISIVIPCHRVIGSSGRLTGYAGGIENKELLLKLEGHTLSFATKETGIIHD